MSTQDTPLTDANAVWVRVVDQSDHASPHEQMVEVEKVRDLERVANRLADALENLRRRYVQCIGNEGVEVLEAKAALRDFEELKK